GLPPTSGLIGKLEVVAASLTPGGAWGIVTLVVVLLASVIGLVAMLRLWRGALWGEDMAQTRTATEPDLPARVPARVLVPGGEFGCVAVAPCLGYGAVAPQVDRAVGGRVDTTGYVDTVLDGEDAFTATTIGGTP